MTTPLDEATDEQALALLLDCCESPHWAHRLAAERPYRHLDTLLTRSDAIVMDLPDDELDLALAAHPRIGDRPDNANSVREQEAAGASDAAVLDRLRSANLEYEERFGHVYLVCAQGKTADELLAILHARLRNDPDAENLVVRRELANINRLRLARLCAMSE